ncbi:MAG: hypothetical protein HRU15_08315 [Planctomycetes bacterium]|nr:hypothetical protein [Planctomycetota bacterium]
MKNIIILLIILSAGSLTAAEGLSVSFKTNSMYDKPARWKNFYGPCFNSKMVHWNGTGTMCVVIWLEDRKGNLIKTIARWANNSGYEGKGVRGQWAGRAYDLVYWNGLRRQKKNVLAIKYNKKVSSDPEGGSPPAGQKSTCCYDSIMGPTIGAPMVGGVPEYKHGDLISMTDKGRKPWDFTDRFGNHLAPGKYRLCIEGVEFAHAKDQQDYVKIIDVDYDGFSFNFSEKGNISPVMSPSTMHPNEKKQIASRPVIYDIQVTYSPAFPDIKITKENKRDLAKVMKAMSDLENSKASKRKSAVKKLGKIGALAQVALPALEKALNDENKYVAKFAQASIDKIKAAVSEKSG